MESLKHLLWKVSQRAKEENFKKNFMLRYLMVSLLSNILALTVGIRNLLLLDQMMVLFKFQIIQRTKRNNLFKDLFSRFKRLIPLRLKIVLQIWIIPMITSRNLFMNIQHQSQPLRKILKILQFLHQVAKNPMYSCGTQRVNLMKLNLLLKLTKLSSISPEAVHLIRVM